ncbi:MAG: helix-turn-helix domain-containing protein [Eubacteriales bacterium]|nr:helix-turn-helix domain-containing protein [Eubacteriales bacterium]
MNRPSTFAKRLRELLDLTDTKQAELSKKSGVHKSSITHYLKGDWEAKQDVIYAIATSMNVDEAWLMGYDVPMERKKDSISEAPEIDKNLQKIIDCYKKMDHIGQESLAEQAEFLLSKHPKEENESCSA